MVIYTLIGLIGLPVFAGGGGPSYILAPTFGFIFSFILIAFISGLIYEKLKIPNNYLKGTISTIIGVFILYIPGLIYFHITVNNVAGKPMGLLASTAIVMAPFVLPDIIKGILVGAINKALTNR